MELLCNENMCVLAIKGIPLFMWFVFVLIPLAWVINKIIEKVTFE